MDLFRQRVELLKGEPRIADQASQRASVKRVVVGNGEMRNASRPLENHVAAPLTGEFPARTLNKLGEGPCSFRVRERSSRFRTPPTGDSIHTASEPGGFAAYESADWRPRTLKLGTTWNLRTKARDESGRPATATEERDEPRLRAP